VVPWRLRAAFIALGKASHKLDRKKEPTMQKIILVGGGARSGKSRFALAYARRLGARRLFVATATAGDAEMGERIMHHREERGSDFTTLEEPLRLPGLLAQPHDVDVIVVDCLTLWLSNLLMHNHSAAAIEEQVNGLLAAITRRHHHVVLVSNEVGLGIVPESALARRFRDIVGRAHQQIAAQADEVYLAAMGMVLRLTPEPVKTFRLGEAP
jgi:adenosylcobinamide kinase / adenosylcobinamide-phosphate guanylyltransferase